MDTRAPHDIRKTDEIPEKERKHFVPIPEAEAVDLEAMSPKERAEWLRNRRQRTLNAPLVSSTAQKVYDRDAKYLETVRETIQKSKREKENVSKLLGYVLGMRAFIHEFLLEEAAIRDVLEERCGVSRADYQQAVEGHMRAPVAPRLYEVVERLINEAPVFEGTDFNRPDVPLDVVAGVDEDAGGLVAPEPDAESHEECEPPVGRSPDDTPY